VTYTITDTETDERLGSNTDLQQAVLTALMLASRDLAGGRRRACKVTGESGELVASFEKVHA
jgi:hypothetical protein